MGTTTMGAWAIGKIFGLNEARQFQNDPFDGFCLFHSGEHHRYTAKQIDIFNAKSKQRLHRDKSRFSERSCYLQLEASETWPSHHVGSKTLTSFGLRGFLRIPDSSYQSTSSVIDIRVTFQLFQKHRFGFGSSLHHGDFHAVEGWINVRL